MLKCQEVLPFKHLLARSIQHLIVLSKARNIFVYRFGLYVQCKLHGQLKSVITSILSNIFLQ